MRITTPLTDIENQLITFISEANEIRGYCFGLGLQDPNVLQRANDWSNRVMAYLGPTFPTGKETGEFFNVTSPSQSYDHMDRIVQQTVNTLNHKIMVLEKILDTLTIYYQFEPTDKRLDIDKGSESLARVVDESKSAISELHIVWGPLRAVLENRFTFNNIKEIVGLAGIDLTSLSHLQQKQGTTTSKGQLMTALDGLVGPLPENEKRRFITIVAEEVLRRRADVAGTLQDYLSRLGWTVHEGVIIPLEILDVSELPELPNEARPDLVKAAQRLRDGDLSGAISAACGAVDATTSKIYRDKSLGEPGAASFQERIARSLKVQGTLTRLDEDLQALGWEVKEIKPFRENLTKSINQAAYVMQTLRANMGDVHGSKPILKPLVFDSIKWAALIIRLLA